MANRKSISHRCHPILVAFVWELTNETIHLPLGCLQGGFKAVNDKRKHGLSTEQFPVSAYVGSSNNLKDLKGTLSLRQEHPECALNPIYAEAGENGPAINV